MDPAFESGHRDDVAGSAQTTPDDVSADVLDTLFDVLSADRRRYALQHLIGTTSTVPLAELADYVATAESMGDQEAVAIDLHHRHLPKLAEEGLVRYDAEANQATATAAGRQFDTVRAALLAREA
jgi:hypothetical protein